MNWHKQCECVSQAVTKYANSLKVIAHLVPNNCKKALYYAYPYSKIKYGIEVYGHCTKSDTKRIQTLQNRILKNLFQKDHFTPTRSLHKDLQILLVKDIFNTSLNEFVFKQRSNLLPCTFNGYYSEIRERHAYNTRNNVNLQQPFVRTVKGQKTTKFYGVKMYNNLPSSVKEASSLRQFKNRAKKCYIVNY